MISRRSRFGWTLAAALCLGAAACGADARTADDEASDDAEATAAVVGERGAPGRAVPPAFGPAAFFRTALDELDLTSAQRATIEQADRDVRAALPPPPARGDHPKEAQALARAIRDGKVDVDALAPPPPADGDARREHLVEALRKLHDTLDASQRRALADLVTQRLGEASAMGPPPPPPAGADASFGPLGPLLGGISIDEEQRAKIAGAIAASIGDGRGGLPSHEEMESRRREMIAQEGAVARAFAAEKFDADAVLPAPPDRAMPPIGGPRDMLAALAAVVPLLDAEQREKLATKIESGPPPMEMPPPPDAPHP